jgi:hypothetical protein
MYNITGNPGYLPKVGALPARIGHRTPIRKKILKTKSTGIQNGVLNEVNSLINLTTSNILDNNNSNINNIRMKAMKNSRSRGPLDMPGTIAIKNKFRIKCPVGSLRNQLGQCVKKYSF